MIYESFPVLKARALVTTNNLRKPHGTSCLKRTFFCLFLFAFKHKQHLLQSREISRHINNSWKILKALRKFESTLVGSFLMGVHPSCRPSRQRKSANLWREIIYYDIVKKIRIPLWGLCREENTKPLNESWSPLDFCCFFFSSVFRFSFFTLVEHFFSTLILSKAIFHLFVLLCCHFYRCCEERRIIWHSRSADHNLRIIKLNLWKMCHSRCLSRA